MKLNRIIILAVWFLALAGGEVLIFDPEKLRPGWMVIFMFAMLGVLVIITEIWQSSDQDDDLMLM